MLTIPKKLWTVAVRMDGEMDAEIHTSEQAACESAVERVLEAYGYDGPLTAAAINAFMESQREFDGYDELIIEEHTVDINL